MRHAHLVRSTAHLLTNLVILYVLLIRHLVMCCQVDDDSVKCTEAVDLKREFGELVQTTPTKDFNRLELYSPVDELPENVFLDIRFKQIVIYNSNNLSAIHTKSFINTEKDIRSFICYQNFVSRLRNHPPEYDLYEAVSSLVNLEQIYLSLATHENHEIPDWAFRPVHGLQLSFKFVEWYGYYTITRIGHHVVFVLPNVEQIIFKYVIVQKISADAFMLPDNKRDRDLDIKFLNTSLTENSFEPGVFANCFRKVKLDLSKLKHAGKWAKWQANLLFIFSIGYNCITILKQDIFEPFFEADEHNYLIVNKNPLNCSDVQSFRWLWERKHLYQTRVLKAYCSDGTNFWSLANSSLTTISETTTESTENLTTGSESEIDTTLDVTDETEANTEVSADPDIPQTSDKPCTANCDNDSDSDNESGSDATIDSINKRLQDLIDLTDSDNSLNTSEQLVAIVGQIEEFRLTLDSISSMDYEIAFNLTNQVLNVLSNLLNQNNAWLKTKDELRSEIAAQVLSQIQMTSFFLTCNHIDHNKTMETIINDNVVVSLYKNFNQNILFEVNDSSILIPEEALTKNASYHCGNSSLATLISRIDQYLGNGLDQEYVNTDLVSFSATNSSDIVQFEDGINIKIRYFKLS